MKIHFVISLAIIFNSLFSGLKAVGSSFLKFFTTIRYTKYELVITEQIPDKSILTTASTAATNLPPTTGASPGAGGFRGVSIGASSARGLEQSGASARGLEQSGASARGLEKSGAPDLLTDLPAITRNTTGKPRVLNEGKAVTAEQTFSRFGAREGNEEGSAFMTSGISQDQALLTGKFRERTILITSNDEKAAGIVNNYIKIETDKVTPKPNSGIPELTSGPIATEASKPVKKGWFHRIFVGAKTEEVKPVVLRAYIPYLDNGRKAGIYQRVLSKKGGLVISSALAVPFAAAIWGLGTLATGSPDWNWEVPPYVPTP